MGMEGGFVCFCCFFFLGGGGYTNKMGYIYIDIINQYHAHTLSSFIALLISFL